MSKTIQETCDPPAPQKKRPTRLKVTVRHNQQALIEKLIERTASVCPVCLARIDAEIVLRGDDYFMDIRCDKHGRFSTVVWRGETPAFESWGKYQAPEDKYSPDCPNECGLCPGHLQKTCCALVEVTRRCNLRCPICFADGGASAAVHDLEVSELSEVFKSLADCGNTFVQLSGGEPTVRDDLPEIISAARRAGCETIQLNSNGVRLGADPSYTKALKEAGLSFVFMQFDGTNDEIYSRLRAEALFDAKCAAIKVCSDNLLGVTLVPTIVPGVNDSDIGNIIDLGLRCSPAVRGVHFQPVSYFGRYPKPPSNHDRITLPEILHAIEDQTKKKFTVSDFTPSSCDHPRCGFHGDFVVLPKMNILKIRKQQSSIGADDSCCDSEKSGAKSASEKGRASPDSCCDNAHLKNRSFIARRWTRSEAESVEHPQSSDYTDMDAFLNRVKSHGFTISAMAFQDAYNLDITRLRRCSLHVASNGALTPFCANYLTAASWGGESG